MFDSAKFEELYRKYYAGLFVYCLAALSRDRDAAAEAVDEAFLTLYRKWDSLDLGGVGIWLYRTADNKMRKILKKKARFSGRTDLYGDAEDLDRLAELRTGDVYFRGEIPEDDAVERVRSSLPEEFRDLFEERFIRKKTLFEISESTGLSYSTLRRRLAKTSLLVREIVADMFRDSDISND